MNYLKFIFGKIDNDKLIYTSLYSLFFISLTSATLSVLDVYNFFFLDLEITFTTGLLFFPLTFVISNLIQDRYNIQTANTVVLVALFSDGVLMLMLKITSILGSSDQYFFVYSPLFKVWCISFFSIIVSCFINNVIFKKLRIYFSKGFIGAFISILTSSVTAEILLTCISLPMILSLSSNVKNTLSAIILNFAYKIIFTFIASVLIAFVKAYLEYKKTSIKTSHIKNIC